MIILCENNISITNMIIFECSPKVKHFLWHLSHNTLAVRENITEEGDGVGYEMLHVQPFG
jgi:hypothetical protein